MTNDDELLVSSSTSRSQSSNLEEAYARMAEMFREHLKPPKRRQKTRPTLASKRRRLKAKRQNSEKKALRGKIKDY